MVLQSLARSIAEELSALGQLVLGPPLRSLGPCSIALYTFCTRRDGDLMESSQATLRSRELAFAAPIPNALLVQGHRSTLHHDST